MGKQSQLFLPNKRSSGKRIIKSMPHSGSLGYPILSLFITLLFAWTIPISGENRNKEYQYAMTSDRTQDIDDSRVLNPGSVIESAISTKETISHNVKLMRGEFIHVELCAMGTDLLITVIGPNHQLIGKWYAARSLPQPIAWIADLPGT
jgi:hypothetical protein